MTDAPAPELTAATWWIGLDGWVLKDGNYTDFAVGDVRQFALEYRYRHTKRLAPADVDTVSCRAVDDDGFYQMEGTLLRAVKEPRGLLRLVKQPTDDCFLLDFGLLAYTGSVVLDNLRPPKAGQRLTGEIRLNVDHFEYTDHLAQLPQMPPMIYTWTIEEIRLDTSPRIQVEYGHPLYGVAPDEGPIRIPDPDRRTWRSIERTRMWDDDGSYTLRCKLHASEPVSTMVTSGDRSPYGPIA